MFSIHFIKNFPQNAPEKKIENRPIFDLAKIHSFIHLFIHY